MIAIRRYILLILSTLVIFACQKKQDTETITNSQCVATIDSLKNLADSLHNKGQLTEALVNYQRAANIALKLKLYHNYVENMIFVYQYDIATGNFARAIDGLDELYKICNEHKLGRTKYNLLNQMISVCLNIDDTEKADELLVEMSKSIPYEEAMTSTQIDILKMKIALAANDENNLRIMSQKLTKIAKDSTVEKNFDKEIYTLLAEYYLYKKNNLQAHNYIEKLLKNDSSSYNLLLLANLENNRGNINESMRILKKLENNCISKNISLYEKYLTLLSKAYFKNENYVEAYNLFKQRIALTDILQKDKIAQDYAYKSLDFRRDTTIMAQHYNIKQQQIELEALQIWRRILITVAIVIVIILLIAFFYSRMIYMRRRVREIAIQNEKLQREIVRQTTILKKQEEELILKKDELTNQIVYASQIQHHILPDIATFNSPFIKDAFIFFKPCQIVSGDFYWCKEKDNKQIIVCADATGHGIPGAFVAMVCATILNNIEHVPEKNTTVGILDNLDMNIRTILHGNNTSNENDSLDISILCIDNLTGRISIATARHSSYLVKKNGDTIRISGAHRSIGDTHPSYMEREFTETNLNVDDDDMLFLTTDGYESQFGGPNNKKLKRNRMLTLFTKIAGKTSEMQKQLLERENELWKGNNEQTDDILVIGIRFKQN